MCRQHGYGLLGDIERIESIMAGETREEGHRDLRRMEMTESDDDMIESTGHTARDTATADLIAEVRKTLSARKATTTVNSYKADYGPPNSNTMTSCARLQSLLKEASSLSRIIWFSTTTMIPSTNRSESLAGDALFDWAMTISSMSLATSYLTL